MTCISFLTYQLRYGIFYFFFFLINIFTWINASLDPLNSRALTCLKLEEKKNSLHSGTGEIQQRFSVILPFLPQSLESTQLSKTESTDMPLKPSRFIIDFPIWQSKALSLERKYEAVKDFSSP